MKNSMLRILLRTNSTQSILSGVRLAPAMSTQNNLRMQSKERPMWNGSSENQSHIHAIGNSSSTSPRPSTRRSAERASECALLSEAEGSGCFQVLNVCSHHKRKAVHVPQPAHKLHAKHPEQSALGICDEHAKQPAHAVEGTPYVEREQ